MLKKSFMQGAAVLAVAGLIIKFLGACFRIPLANFIGDEGMGFYQTAYPVYVLFLTSWKSSPMMRRASWCLCRTRREISKSTIAHLQRLVFKIRFKAFCYHLIVTTYR